MGKYINLLDEDMNLTIDHFGHHIPVGKGVNVIDDEIAVRFPSVFKKVIESVKDELETKIEEIKKDLMVEKTTFHQLFAK